MEKRLPDVLAWLFEADPLDDRAVETRARQLFLDTLGCMIAGMAKPSPRKLGVALWRIEPGPVTLTGVSGSFSVSAGAYLAGLAACWGEACEGLPRAHGRPGLHSFAAALPLALQRNATLGETLTALVAGYEVAGRLGAVLRIKPGMHVDGTWGTFGAATAAARLMGLSPEITMQALRGAACQLPWSLYLPIQQGADIRNAYVGEAARRGIMQVLAAAADIGAPVGAIEVFNELALGAANDASLLVDSGEWLLLEGYLKPFAAVRHVHYGAQAAIDWRRGADNPDSRHIQSLTLSIYGEALTYCGNRAPVTPIQAQFSLSYGLASALVRGDLGPEAYDANALRDSEVRRLEALVSLVEDPVLTLNNERAATLTVMTKESLETITASQLPGDPGFPLTTARVEAKFLRYSTPIIGADRAAEIASAVLNGPLSTPLNGIV